jgi:amidase
MPYADSPQTDPSPAGAVDLLREIRAGDLDARTAVRDCLDRIGRSDGTLNAFSVVDSDRALERAAELDTAFDETGPVGPLHGLPIAIKDENDVAGLATAYGGAAFSTPAATDGEVVRRLREAGAVIVGKTRMPEFGIWPFTETSAHGRTLNPWDHQRSPGGSSGGSAAAVASGMVPVAIGGDGGGSIRIPSSFCGLVGFKCGRGIVSAAPNRNLWRSLGVIGPLTRTVADSALIYDVIAGTTATDEFRSQPWRTPLSEAVSAPFAPLRIAVSLRNPVHGPGPDAATRAAVEETAEILRELGHQVERADPRYPGVTLPFLFQVAAGVADEAARAEHPRLLERRTRSFLRLTRPGVPFGGWAQRRGLRLERSARTRPFGEYDLLLTPTTATVAPRIGQLDGAGAITAILRATPVASYTSIWNVLGAPAVAVPAGVSDEGLPRSVQLIGPPGQDHRVISVAAQVESNRI